MPCRWSRRCGAATTNNDLPSPTNAPDVEDWKTVRRYHLRLMRKQVRSVVLFLALTEAIRHGPADLVYAGKHGYPAPSADDFGIAYNVGYFLSWLYMCAFYVVFIPLFSWWVPTGSSDSGADDSTTTSSLLSKLGSYLRAFDMFLLPFAAGVCLVHHIYLTICTFIYVDNRKVGSKKFPANTRKNWIVRALFLLGIAISTSTGYGAFQILAATDLAHVKPIEYAIIVVPFQINFGIFLGTIMQFKMEKRMARKQAIQLESAKTEQAVLSEKQALLDV